ncbi:MAG: hypothetical protein OEV44_00210 [Spirochaetota bacterium]|nr:hypothetical protein [Spirochaetota bacterium]
MKLSNLKLNPDNPQKFDDLTSLENSIKNFPKMMKLRPIIYDPEKMIVLGGNKRLICLQNLGYKEIPDEWVKSADELTEDEKKRFVIQDNIQIGEWDIDLLENWDFDELKDWGLGLEKNDYDIEIIESEDSDKRAGTFTTNISSNKTAMYIGKMYGIINKEFYEKIINKYDFIEGNENHNGIIFEEILKKII